MNITDIRIRRTFQDEKLKALVSITIDNDLAVHDIKVIDGAERLFVAMPSRRDENGVFRDIAHPITPDARRIMEESILNAYMEYLENKESDVSVSDNTAAPLQNGQASEGIYTKH